MVITLKHVGALLVSILIWILKLFLRQFNCSLAGKQKNCDNKTVITSTVWHCLQRYAPVLLPTSIAMHDLHSIPYSNKYHIFILIHKFRYSRLAADRELSAAYRVRRSRTRACNNSWCILETHRRTTPWWDRCCFFSKTKTILSLFHAVRRAERKLCTDHQLCASLKRENTS
jgi:hypothetical protein